MSRWTYVSNYTAVPLHHTHIHTHTSYTQAHTHISQIHTNLHANIAPLTDLEEERGRERESFMRTRKRGREREITIFIYSGLICIHFIWGSGAFCSPCLTLIRGHTCSRESSCRASLCIGGVRRGGGGVRGCAGWGTGSLSWSAQLDETQWGKSLS